MKWALIDASFLGHRARHTMRALSHDGIATQITFGFLEQLRTVCCDPRVATNRVAVFFDSRQSFRRDAYPDYKRARAAHRTPAEWMDIRIMQDQLKMLRRKILPAIGCPVFRQIGLESDDLMAQSAAQLEFHGAVMITSDGDLYQCITEHVHWFDPSRDLYLDPAAFQQKKHVGPNDWADVKCMAGCHTDGVAGVPGVGEKTAVDFIWKLLKPGNKRLGAIMSPTGQKIIRRNRRLVKLPHAKTSLVNIVEPKWDYAAFERWCVALGFTSYIADGVRSRAWKQFFAGEFSGRQTQRARTRG